MNPIASRRNTGGLTWSATNSKSSSAASREKHAVAIAEKAVSFLDRVAISGQHPLAAGKGAHQHQQARLRQMKVSEQAVRDAKFITRRNEKIRRPRMRCVLAR